MTKNEKTVIAIAAIWYLFFRDKGAAALPAGKPHPVGPVTSTAQDSDGNPVPIGRPGQTASAPITSDDGNQPNTPIEINPQ
jgi:hypothetical protein